MTGGHNGREGRGVSQQSQQNGRDERTQQAGGCDQTSMQTIKHSYKQTTNDEIFDGIFPWSTLFTWITNFSEREEIKKIEKCERVTGQKRYLADDPYYLLLTALLG